MNKDELVGYIQGLLDMSKDAIKISDSELAIKEIEKTLLTLISKSLEKHRISQIKNDINYFNKKADEYSTPLGNTNTQ